jgi:hypothetical protein
MDITNVSPGGNQARTRFEDGSTSGIGFDEGDGFNVLSLESKMESSNTCECIYVLQPTAPTVGCVTFQSP